MAVFCGARPRISGVRSSSVRNLHIISWIITFAAVTQCQAAGPEEPTPPFQPPRTGCSIWYDRYAEQVQYDESGNIVQPLEEAWPEGSGAGVSPQGNEAEAAWPEGSGPGVSSPQGNDPEAEWPEGSGPAPGAGVDSPQGKDPDSRRLRSNVAPEGSTLTRLCKEGSTYPDGARYKGFLCLYGGGWDDIQMCQPPDGADDIEDAIRRRSGRSTM